MTWKQSHDFFYDQLNEIQRGQVALDWPAGNPAGYIYRVNNQGRVLSRNKLASPAK